MHESDARRFLCRFTVGAAVVRRRKGLLFFAVRSDANVESPGGISPPGAPRTVREPLDSHGSRCSAIDTRGQRLCLIHELLLSPVGFSWPVASAEQRSPFAPAPLQNLHRYYELLRPYAPHRYSDPRGLNRL